MPIAEVVATGVRFGEGPVWRPRHHDLVVTSVMDGTLVLVDPFSGSTQGFADLGGGPNGLVPCADGGAIVAQNGGIDFRQIGGGRFVDAPTVRRVKPSVQRISSTGQPRSLSPPTVALQAPNDLVVEPDGVSIIFTDPPHHPLPPRPVGRVLRLTPSTDVETATVQILASGLTYPNGVVIVGEDVVIVEQDGLLAIHPDGTTDWLVRDLGAGGGDGMALDQDGRIYVCAKQRSCVRVIDAAGRVVEVLEAPSQGHLTNCCFGGDDLRVLFVTDAYNDRVLAFPDMPVPGFAVVEWASPFD